LKPKATAMASNKVDFPEPFSPMKYVTFGWKITSSNPCKIGKLKGNSLLLCMFSFFKSKLSIYCVYVSNMKITSCFILPYGGMRMRHVIVMEHQEDWKEKFNMEAEKIKQIFGDCMID